MIAKVATTASQPTIRRRGAAPTTAVHSATSTQTAGTVTTACCSTSPKEIDASACEATRASAVPATSRPTAVEASASTTVLAR
ncbi:hypothetical protein [Luteococcus peritonei]|uniref:Uncharacterized protein n=1 Tax=Luteococcus peritonei TaxID=88874 RepID=A0ABW4RVX2_9ACTN